MDIRKNPPVFGIGLQDNTKKRRKKHFLK